MPPKGDREQSILKHIKKGRRAGETSESVVLVHQEQQQADRHWHWVGFFLFGASNGSRFNKQRYCCISCCANFVYLGPHLVSYSLSCVFPSLFARLCLSVTLIFQSEDFGGVPLKLATDGIRSVATHEDRRSVALFGNLDLGGGQAVILLDSDDGSLKWIWEVRTQLATTQGQRMNFGFHWILHTYAFLVNHFSSSVHADLTMSSR